MEARAVLASSSSRTIYGVNSCEWPDALPYFDSLCISGGDNSITGLFAIKA